MTVPIPNSYILYDSIYMSLKSHILEVDKQISGYQGLGSRRRDVNVLIREATHGILGMELFKILTAGIH